MKKKIVLMSIAAVLVLTAIIGGTLAGFQTETAEQGTTDITTKSLGIELVDGEVPMAAGIEEAKVGMPGDEIEMPYNIVNDIPDGYELYTRVTIYKYWDSENNELDPEMIQLRVQGEELTEGMVVNDWIVWYADEEQVIAYYTKPLATGEATSNIVDTLYIAPEINNDYTGETVMLEIKADAVQAAVAKDGSIPSEWGVFVDIDENGVITKIEE